MRKKGDIVRGHFCYDCLEVVGPSSKENPEKTDWCIRCDHKGAGKVAESSVVEWLAIAKGVAI